MSIRQTAARTTRAAALLVSPRLMAKPRAQASSDAPARALNTRRLCERGAGRVRTRLLVSAVLGLLLAIGVGIGDAAAAGRYSNRGPWSNDRAEPPPAASTAPAPCETGGLAPTRPSARRGGACDEPRSRRRRIK